MASVTIHDDMYKYMYIFLCKRCLSTNMKPLWKVENIHMCAYTYTFTHLHFHLHLHKNICIYTHTQIHVHVHVRLRVRVGGRGEGGEGRESGVGWVGGWVG